VKNNLKNVYLSPKDELVYFNGWPVFASNDYIYIEHLNPLSRKHANCTFKKNHMPILHSASIHRDELTYSPPALEDDLYNTPRPPVTAQLLKITPQPDDKIYYRFYLGNREDISFSSAFDIILDKWVEDPYLSENYSRLVYASLSEDVPIILDSRNVICISPFH